MADAITAHREYFLEHHESLRIWNWKAKLLNLLVDIENSNSVLAKIAKLLLEFDGIYNSTKYTIKHWYIEEAGKEIGKRNGAGREENQDWTSFYGIMDLWEFPDLKNLYGNGKVDLKSIIKQQYTSTGNSTIKTDTAADDTDVSVEPDRDLSDYEQDLVNMMNSDNPLNKAKYLGKYFWDRWPGYWGKLMEQNLLNSGVDPEWAKIGGDYSSTFILEGFMAITINGVRAYKNMKTGEIIYSDTVLGSGIGSTAKGTKTASSVVDEAGATAAKGASKSGLLDELASSGVKYNADDVVAITKNSDGKLVWLENGNANAGLEHIMNHADEFAAKGIPNNQISDFVMDALENGKIIGYQGRGTGRPIYEVVYNGVTQRVAITTGSNGFIVGANPVSIK